DLLGLFRFLRGLPHARGPHLFLAVLVDDEFPDGLGAVVAQAVERVKAAAVAVPARSAEFDDPRVAAGPVGEALGDVVHDLLGDHGALHGPEDAAEVRQPALLRQRDEMLRAAAELLGLLDGRDHAAADEEALPEVALQPP